MTERHAPAPQPLPDDIEALQALVRSQREQIAELEQQLAWFMVHYRLAQQRRFGASSETCPHQLDLFADILEQALAAATQATTASLLGDANAGSDEQADGPGEAPPPKGRREVARRCRASYRARRSRTTCRRRTKSAPAAARCAR